MATNCSAATADLPGVHGDSLRVHRFDGPRLHAGAITTVKTNESIGEYAVAGRTKPTPGLSGTDTILSADKAAFSARIVDAELIKLSLGLGGAGWKRARHGSSSL